MAAETFVPLKGHCACRAVTYEVLAPFLFTNCCHCTWCQRESGAAFALNSIIETSNFHVTSETKPVVNNIPTASGHGQMMARCPNCRVVLYSDYGESGEWTVFVRAGTLDDEGKRIVKPDIHIFTSTKLEWIDLSGEKARGIPIMEGSYKFGEAWGKESRDRYAVLKQRIKEANQTSEGVDE